MDSSLLAGGFAVCKLAVLLYLLGRNRIFDRINAVMYMPLVAQDFVQAYVWSVMDPAVDTANSCSAENSRATFLQMVLLLGLPMQWAWVEYLICGLLSMSKQSIEAHGVERIATAFNTQCPEFSTIWRRRNLLEPLHHRIRVGLGTAQLFLMMGTVFLICRGYYPRTADWDSWGLSWLFPGPTCTTLGPYGYQVWPMVVFPSWPMRCMFGVSFAMVASIYNYVPFPSLMSSVTDCLGLVGVGLFLVVGDEYASVWSTVQSCGIFFALAEPTLLRAHRILDAEALAEDGDDLRASLGRVFAMAWHRFSVLRLVPWGQDPVHEEEEQFDFDPELEMGSACSATGFSKVPQDAVMSAPTSITM